MNFHAVVDCDNCFVSCERVFRPDLQHKPVVVLSNNDGCIISRSNEAKAMGVKMGMPFFKAKQQYPDIIAFSSNPELYGELTGRVMYIIAAESSEFSRYSIDEAFLVLRQPSSDNLKTWGESLFMKIHKKVGLPVSIGISTNKTLAKVASYFAKKNKGYNHCCVIDTDEKRMKALKLLPVGEVWGIGRKLTSRLSSMGVQTAWDFAQCSHEWVSALFNVTAIRTWRELNGDDCIAADDTSRKKSICVSRSFESMVGDVDTLSSHVTNFAVRCAEKLRRQNSLATRVGVFISTNPFREDLTQDRCFCEEYMLTPTNATISIVQSVSRCVNKIFRKGLLYKKAGVVVTALDAELGVQTDLLEFDSEKYAKRNRLDAVVDKINKLGGGHAVVLGSQCYSGGHKKVDGTSGLIDNAMRHQFRSQRFTTRWDEIIELH